ncbi:MAG TPA: hypothetical protein DD417_02815 [Elusimicrobia bacterium]|nr:hypothetical protein [Elusimicrobiota bacterium]
MNREKRVATYLLLAFSLVSLILLSLPLTGKVQTFRWVVSYVLSPAPFYANRAFDRFSNIPSDAARLISADLELQEARRRLTESELVRAEADSLRLENERLRGALGIQAAGAKVIRWARVMQRDPLTWNRSVMVDAGAEEGVKLNAPVLGVQGSTVAILGRVAELGAHTAKVLLLSDELSAAAAYLPGQGWEGLVQGQGSARLRLNYLPVDAQLTVGSEVCSSPTSATFPANLRIGTISKVFARDPFLAFQSAEVAAAVPPSVVKEVMILDPAFSK